MTGLVSTPHRVQVRPHRSRPLISSHGQRHNRKPLLQVCMNIFVDHLATQILFNHHLNDGYENRENVQKMFALKS